MITVIDNTGPFTAGDIPGTSLQAWFDSDLVGFTNITAKLNGLPFGTVPVPVGDAPAIFPYPANDPFPVAGRYQLSFDAVKIVASAVIARVRIGTAAVIVTDDDGWHTLDTARADWTDAPSNDSNLYDLLEVAKDQVLVFAPELPELAPVPVNYRQAQLMQARALWQSTMSNSADQMNADGFTVTVYPMDRTIKNILRPRAGLPMAVTE